MTGFGTNILGFGTGGGRGAGTEKGLKVGAAILAGPATGCEIAFERKLYPVVYFLAAPKGPFGDGVAVSLE